MLTPDFGELTGQRTTMFGVRFEMDNFAKYREMKTGHEVKNQKWGAIARSPALVVKKTRTQNGVLAHATRCGGVFLPDSDIFSTLVPAKELGSGLGFMLGFGLRLWPEG